MRVLSVWVQYWPNTLLPAWRHSISVCVFECVCVHINVWRHSGKPLVQNTMCLCDWFRWSHGGRDRVVAFIFKLQNQCKVDLNERTTHCFHPTYVCVCEQQTTVGHYSSDVSVATLNDDVVVTVATNKLMLLHLHLERERERETVCVCVCIRNRWLSNRVISWKRARKYSDLFVYVDYVVFLSSFAEV